MDRRSFLQQSTATAILPVIPQTVDWISLAEQHADRLGVRDLLVELLTNEPNREGVVLHWACSEGLADLVDPLKGAVPLTTWQEIGWVCRLQKKTPLACFQHTFPQNTDDKVEMQLPFERAAAAGHLECVKLLQGRPDANLEQGMLEACQFGRPEVVRYFLSLGMDARSGDSLWLRHACQHGGGSWGPSNVPEATEVVKMLLHAGADPNTRNPKSGWSALKTAAHWGNRETCRALLEGGAVPCVEALEEAHNYPKITQLLIDHGTPKPSLDYMRKLAALNRFRTLPVVLDSYPWSPEELLEIQEAASTPWFTDEPRNTLEIIRQRIG